VLSRRVPWLLLRRIGLLLLASLAFGLLLLWWLLLRWLLLAFELLFWANEVYAKGFPGFFCYLCHHFSQSLLL